MRIWLIKMLYRFLSPSEQWECHKYLEQPSLDAVLKDQCDRIDKNWLRSATYKATKSNGGES
jgi:hypothetical protein